MTSDEDERQEVTDVDMEVLVMTRDDSHVEGTLQAGSADVPSTMVATPRAVAVALGPPAEVPPPVASQHHKCLFPVCVSHTEASRGNESGEFERFKVSGGCGAQSTPARCSVQNT